MYQKLTEPNLQIANLFFSKTFTFFSSLVGNVLKIANPSEKKKNIRSLYELGPNLDALTVIKGIFGILWSVAIKLPYAKMSPQIGNFFLRSENIRDRI